VSVDCTQKDPETVALATDIWVALDQIGFPKTGSRPGEDTLFVSGGTPGVELEVQSVEDASDDPLLVFAQWLAGEGFRVKFVYKNRGPRFGQFRTKLRNAQVLVRPPWPRQFPRDSVASP
jgi:hypothetical protein